MKEHFDLPYRDRVSEKCRMDIAQPETPNGAAIFFVHGGGWSGGSRRQWHPAMRHFCQQGYVCASAGYRLTDETVFPHIFEDVRTAMAVFLSRAPEYGFDPHRVAAFGSSAGGHLVSMLATTDAANPLGMTPDAPTAETRPACTVALCSVFSCHQVGGYYNPKFFGMEEAENPAIYTAASPIDHIDSRVGPFLIVTGDADTTTPLPTQNAMRDRLAAHGVRCDLKVLPGVGHGYGYGAESDAQRAMLAYADAFLQDVLGVS